MPNTYTELRKTTVGTATASVTLDLTGISGYTDLVLVVEGIATANSTSTLSLQFNGDTASNYSGTRLSGNGSTASSDRYSTATVMGGGLITSSVRFNNIINIQNYSNTTTFKTVLFRSNVSDSLVRTSVNLWRSTAAITQIDVLATATTFASGTTLSLYGIANADQGAAKATGGIITEDSQYWYHTFGASSAFIPKQSLTCDVLVVAGGGGTAGSDLGGGGGGAGGLLAFTSQALTAISYNVTVGAGGVAQTNGNNSQFASLTASVGGGKGATNAAVGSVGGSGGGGAYATYTTGYAASPSGQGNAGGNGFTASFYGVGGGGGGAGAVGVNGNATNAGNGGAGVNTYSSWLSATGLGVSGFIAGGGGGGAYNGIQSIGGSGGGGAGGRNGGAAIAGTVNTGGGAGGAGENGAGANGGSGVVIVRYAK
jgi:hypothetical protein